MLKSFRLPLAAAGLILSLSAVNSSSAAVLSPEQAVARFKSLQNGREMAPGSYSLAFTAGEAGRETLYVFNTASGFTILSADDIALPVLGYSDSSSFDADNIPANLRWWLSQYDEEINAGREAGITMAHPQTAAPEKANRQNVAPMLHTEWDQNDPYNYYTPTSWGQKTPTGCVATAMSQIMKYFNWPSSINSNLAYYDEKSFKHLSMPTSSTTFNWSQMIDNYTTQNYTAAQRDAVARLMQAAGYSVEMQYGMDSSGAYNSDVAGALAKVFDYDKALSYRERGWYSASEWDEMVYGNLINCGPVYYAGTGPDGGHAFVCDGYRASDGMYHFNWGWSGTSDGYFHLNALEPSMQGTGGNTTGFNLGHAIVIGIRLPVEGSSVSPVVVAQKGMSASLDGRTLTMGSNEYLNYSFETIALIYGMRFTDRATGEYINCWSNRGVSSLPTNSYATSTYSVEIPVSLPDGVYLAQPVIYPHFSSPVDGDEVTRILYKEGLANCFQLTSEGGRLSIAAAGIDLPIADRPDSAPVYYDLNGHQVNPAQLAPGLYIRLLNGQTEKILVK